MNVLLLSMPDSFEHMPPVAIRMPNGALASLAGNVDPHHRVAIADLILVQPRCRATVERLVRELAARRRRPVGDDVSARDRADDRAARCGGSAPGRAVVVGGYDPSLAPEAYERVPRRGLHRARRGRADVLRAAPRARARRRIRRRSPACRIERRTASCTTPIGRSPGSPSNPLRLPNRAARVLSGYTLLGRPVDVVETSRGCTFDCSFCSIIEMRGRNFHAYPIERVMADIARRARRGARAIFLVDDNITLDVAPVRGAVPRDHRARLQRRRLHRPGDDGAASPSTARRWRR